VFTQGGVVPPGFKMMEIVPTDDPLVVEGSWPVNLVDRVHPGLKTELIFSAFNANKTPHIPGEVEQVAADRTVDERTGAPYLQGARARDAGRPEADRPAQRWTSARHAGRAVREDGRAHDDELPAQADLRPRQVVDDGGVNVTGKLPLALFAACGAHCLPARPARSPCSRPTRPR
jgi:hypothetical protein